MTPQVFVPGMHIADDGTLVIHADEAAEAGVKSIEFIEGTPEARIAELEARLDAIDAALDDADAPDSTEAHAMDNDPIIKRIKLWRNTQETTVEFYEWRTEAARNAQRTAEAEHLAVCAELDEAMADVRRLREALKACDIVMDTAAIHGLPQQLPPAYRDSWARAHTNARTTLAAEQADGEKGAKR